MGGPSAIRCSLVLVLVVGACGGGGKKTSGKPKTKHEDKTEQGPETEADREKSRHDKAVAIVPEGSQCLPVALREENAPRLELGNINGDAVVCAIDTDPKRLLGPIGCWKVTDYDTGALSYVDPVPLPGRGFDAPLDDGCARGFCLPKGAKAGGKVAHIAWNLDEKDKAGTKVAVLVGDDVHLFDAGSKAHESSFSIRGDKGVTNNPVAIHYVRDHVFVEGAEDGSYAAVWSFKTDGTAEGPINGLGGKDEKPVSIYHGSFSVLDTSHVGLAEKGMETLTTFEVGTGKRAKLVRKVGKLSCKPDELDAFWHDGDKVTDKCKESVMKASGHLMGATAVMGTKSLLVLLRDERLGQLDVLDPKSLAEKKVIKMPWCTGGEDKGDKDDDKAVEKKKADKGDEKKSDKKKADKKADADEDEASDKKADKKKNTTRGGAKRSPDPEEGGE